MRTRYSWDRVAQTTDKIYGSVLARSESSLGLAEAEGGRR
jgi:hypothetical protein